MTRIWSGRRAALVLAVIGAGTQAAGAADMPYAKAAPVSSVYDWSGFYIGGMLGGMGERNEATTPGGEVLNPIRNYAARFMGGGYAGYNAQFSNLVVGVEGDIGSVLGSKSVSSAEPTIAPGFFASSASDPKWLATVTGRVGLALNNWLLYGKAGGAWMDSSYTGNVETAGRAVFATQTVSTTRSGWVAGGGIEYAWNPNWLSRIEYDYVDFGTKRVTYTLAGINNVDYKNADHIVKIGIAYKFGGSRF